MAGEGNNNNKNERKPRLLCLHGFRTSGEIMKKQIQKWDDSILQKLDLVFVDGPSPAEGKSNVEGIFDPPYFEWFQTNHDQTVYKNFEKCLDYVEDYMIKHGPFDGLLGFSQGAYLSAALPGLQAQGVALKKVPKIKFLIIVSGAKMKDIIWAKPAYATPIQCPSLHFLGKEDFLKPFGEELLECCINPLIIHHPKGHTVPRLDDQALEIFHSFLDNIQKLTAEEEEQSNVSNDNGHEMSATIT
ncbi:hypothetical protein RND81_03G237500 [Saponaria officinalis]|uniref:Serine hydrolase domain-containing protein n=1 Tax=Saponaria officinalis TaxID=3572 RepID=A0AAW1MA21_SAPOF